MHRHRFTKDRIEKLKIETNYSNPNFGDTCIIIINKPKKPIQICSFQIQEILSGQQHLLLDSLFQNYIAKASIECGMEFEIFQLKGSGCGCGRAAAAIGSSVCQGTVDGISGKAGAQAWACTGGHRMRHGVGRGHRYPIDQLKGSGCGCGRAAFARAPSTALAGRQGRECQFVVVAIRLSVCCSHIVKVVELFLCVCMRTRPLPLGL